MTNVMEKTKQLRERIKIKPIEATSRKIDPNNPRNKKLVEFLKDKQAKKIAEGQAKVGKVEFKEVERAEFSPAEMAKIIGEEKRGKK